MSSYEDRLRAVQLYIELGKRVRPTIRQLGYPTKNAVKDWHRQFEQRRNVPAGYPSRAPKYSEAQKQAAVAYYLSHDRCIAATRRVLGYPSRGSLMAWIRETAPEARKAILSSAGQLRYPEAVKQAGDRPMHPACERPDGGAGARRVPAHVVQLDEPVTGP